MLTKIGGRWFQPALVESLYPNGARTNVRFISGTLIDIAGSVDEVADEINLALSEQQQ